MKTLLMSLLMLGLLIGVGCDGNSDDNATSFDPSLYTFVPDDKFEQLLINLGYDSALDDYVLTSNIVNVRELPFTSGDQSPLPPSGITDFTGIEDFRSLESFNCRLLGIAQLDLSKNTELKRVDVSGNNLSELDLSNLVNLESLRCDYNNLTSLRVNSSLLRSLSCHENRLSNLDLTQSSNIVQMSCFKNSLTSIDLSGLVNLEVLQIGGNQLTTLDISNNVKLEYLECHNNPLKCVQVNKEQFENDWTFCSQDLFSLKCD